MERKVLTVRHSGYPNSLKRESAAEMEHDVHLSAASLKIMHYPKAIKNLKHKFPYPPFSKCFSTSHSYFSNISHKNI